MRTMVYCSERANDTAMTSADTMRVQQLPVAVRIGCWVAGLSRPIDRTKGLAGDRDSPGGCRSLKAGMCRALRGLTRLQCPQLQELNLFGNRCLDTSGNSRPPHRHCTRARINFLSGMVYNAPAQCRRRCCCVSTV